MDFEEELRTIKPSPWRILRNRWFWKAVAGVGLVILVLVSFSSDSPVSDDDSSGTSAEDTKTETSGEKKITDAEWNELVELEFSNAKTPDGDDDATRE